MKKSLLILFLTLLLVSCGGRESDVEEFQAEQQSSDAIAKSIANYLADFDEIKDCNVQIDGKTAVISLNLAYKHSDAELIALKKRVAADIKLQNSTITHVAVNTAPDMLENIQSGDDNSSELEKALERNDDEEIFVNIVPTI